MSTIGSANSFESFNDVRLHDYIQGAISGAGAGDGVIGQITVGDRQYAIGMSDVRNTGKTICNIECNVTIIPLKDRDVKVVTAQAFNESRGNEEGVTLAVKGEVGSIGKAIKGKVKDIERKAFLAKTCECKSLSNIDTPLRIMVEDLKRRSVTPVDMEITVDGPPPTRYCIEVGESEEGKGRYVVTIKNIDEEIDNTAFRDTRIDKDEFERGVSFTVKEGFFTNIGSAISSELKKQRGQLNDLQSQAQRLVHAGSVVLGLVQEDLSRDLSVDNPLFDVTGDIYVSVNEDDSYESMPNLYPRERGPGHDSSEGDIPGSAAAKGKPAEVPGAVGAASGGVNPDSASGNSGETVENALATEGEGGLPAPSPEPAASPTDTAEAAAGVDGPSPVVDKPPAKPSFEEWTGKACDITKADPKQADELAGKAGISDLDQYIRGRIHGCSDEQLERARRCIVASNLSLVGAEPPNTQEVKNLLEKFRPIIDMAINISAITTGDTISLKHQLPGNDETLKQYPNAGLENLKGNTAVATGLTYLHMMLEESKDLGDEAKAELRAQINEMLKFFNENSGSIPEDPMAFTAKILAQINADRIRKATSKEGGSSENLELLLGIRIPDINVSSGDAVIALVDDIKRQTEELLKKKPEAPPSDGAGAAPAPVKPPASESAPREVAPDKAIVSEPEPELESEPANPPEPAPATVPVAVKAPAPAPAPAAEPAQEAATPPDAALAPVPVAVKAPEEAPGDAPATVPVPAKAPPPGPLVGAGVPKGVVPGPVGLTPGGAPPGLAMPSGELPPPVLKGPPPPPPPPPAEADAPIPVAVKPPGPEPAPAPAPAKAAAPVIGLPLGGGGPLVQPPPLGGGLVPAPTGAPPSAGAPQLRIPPPPTGIAGPPPLPPGGLPQMPKLQMPAARVNPPTLPGVGTMPGLVPPPVSKGPGAPADPPAPGPELAPGKSPDAAAR